MAVIGISHTYYFNEKPGLKSTFSWQHSQSLAVLDSIKNEDIQYLISEVTSQRRNYLFQPSSEKNSAAEDNLSIGLIIDNYKISYLDSMMNRDYNRFITTTDITGGMMLYQAYVQWQHKFGSQIDHLFRDSLSVLWIKH